MDRDALEALAKSYAHAPELTSTQFNDFFALAEARIGRDLKSQENETSLLAQTWATNLQAVPSDYGSMRLLEFEGSRGKVALNAAGLPELDRWNETGSEPRVYAVRSRIVDIRPFTAGDFNIYYYNRPSLPTGASTNAVSVTWPQVYLAALLVEVRTWKEDPRNMEVALGRYNSEVRAINKEAEYSRGGKPAMRRA